MGLNVGDTVYTTRIFQKFHAYQQTELPLL